MESLSASRCRGKGAAGTSQKEASIERLDLLRASRWESKSGNMCAEIVAQRTWPEMPQAPAAISWEACHTQEMSRATGPTPELVQFGNMKDQRLSVGQVGRLSAAERR